MQINGQAVFGYPAGMQNRRLQIKLAHPPDWMLGTPLKRNSDGTFYADNYDYISMIWAYCTSPPAIPSNSFSKKQRSSRLIAI